MYSRLHISTTQLNKTAAEIQVTPEHSTYINRITHVAPGILQNTPEFCNNCNFVICCKLQQSHDEQCDEVLSHIH